MFSMTTVLFVILGAWMLLSLIFCLALCVAASRPALMRRLLFILIAQASLGAARLSAIDFDGDGMSDVWQQKYSVPSADANIDYNGNGL